MCKTDHIVTVIPTLIVITYCINCSNQLFVIQVRYEQVTIISYLIIELESVLSTFIFIYEFRKQCSNFEIISTSHFV